jgi:hypothetical protein
MGDEHHTADCGIYDLDQAKILQVCKRCILVMDDLSVKIRMFVFKRLPRPLHSWLPVHVRRSFGVAV